MDYMVNINEMREQFKGYKDRPAQPCEEAIIDLALEYGGFTFNADKQILLGFYRVCQHVEKILRDQFAHSGLEKIE